MDMAPLATRALAQLLEQQTGQQLGDNRRWRLDAALQPVLREHGLETLDGLAAQAARPAEHSLRAAVVAALLNHETSFFRDRAMFQALDERILPRLAARATGRRLRLWSAGCSTGQEAWSLAMTFAREADRWVGWTIDILGTDVSPDVVQQARGGLYSQFEVQRGLPITDLVRWFEPAGEAWRVRGDLHPHPLFAPHNLLMPPPGTGFDLILCRNVLLYFDPARRSAVLDRLAAALAPDGLLILGAGETVLDQTAALRPDGTQRGCYTPAA